MSAIRRRNLDGAAIGCGRVLIELGLAIGFGVIGYARLAPGSVSTFGGPSDRFQVAMADFQTFPTQSGVTARRLPGRTPRPEGRRRSR